ncbi:MAG: alpha-glucan family phosphorylase [Acidobacteriia bacterium]|nr:alpha-glucan family phosphorylase [Terriglobia bacterium]
MSNPTYTNRPSETESDGLAQLALDLRWTWDHTADELWGRLDPELWEHTQNPWVVLQTIAQDKLEAARRDPRFSQRLEELLEAQSAAANGSTWFRESHEKTPLKLVAYFSMEYMLAEALPIYSGGLGNVAGDQLKAASDLGVPVVAIGLLYDQGYFRQEFDAEGNQIALYPFNDPGQLPIRPLRDANGEWVRLPLALPGLKMWVRAWQARVGRALLYLLDSNDPANPAVFRSITSELYGGGPDTRIRQELILGMGGWRLLRALRLSPEVVHLNEGHAAFAVLERARSWMADRHDPFDVALTVTRAGNVFTTHTAVDAGFDRFAPELVEKYLTHYAENILGIGIQDLLALGRRDRNNRSEPFNMAALAMRGSGRVNGVSRLHGEVSRNLFQPLFPRWPQPDVPVGYVTNGVHVGTWESAESSEFWTAACGHHRWSGEVDHLEAGLRTVSDLELWQLRSRTTQKLIDFTRKRLAYQREVEGWGAAEVEEASRIFDPDVLTMGFARRFATYKRPNLLLHDPDRLLRILTNRERPIQLILAGKAHPQDQGGRALIRQWNDFVSRADARCHVVFLSDYDKVLTQHLVGGVDLWINTPRRPWEACGTSGMKVLANGGLNLSELDGWWAEAYTSEVGWAIGDGQEHGDDPAWDAAEANAVYDLLEHDIVPAFYDRDSQGVPSRWVAKMRESLTRLTPQFSANRTVREYTEAHYLPAAAAYCRRAADGGNAAMEIRRWQRQVAEHWDNLRFGELHVETQGPEHQFRVHVYLDELPPEAVAVELYADPVGSGEPFRAQMSRAHALAGSVGGYVYEGKAPAGRPADSYTARLVPFHDGVAVPLEAAEILWQK